MSALAQNNEIQELVEFIKGQKVTYMATIDGEQACVRPMSALVEIDGKLAWCTNRTKEVFTEVEANPKIEFAMYDKGKTVRLRGTCQVDDTKKGAYLEIQPGVAKWYGGGEADMAVMVFDDAEALVSDKNGKQAVTLY